MRDIRLNFETWYLKTEESWQITVYLITGTSRLKVLTEVVPASEYPNPDEWIADLFRKMLTVAVDAK